MKVDQKAIIPIIVAIFNIMVWLHYAIGGDTVINASGLGGLNLGGGGGRDTYRLVCLVAYILCIVASAILIIGVLLEKNIIVWVAVLLQLIGLIAYIVSPFLTSYRFWATIIFLYYLMMATFFLFLYTACVFVGMLG